MTLRVLCRKIEDGSSTYRVLELMNSHTRQVKPFCFQYLRFRKQSQSKLWNEGQDFADEPDADR